jgi:dTDP-4-dehydrorhamnose 3,5-epimerase
MELLKTAIEDVKLIKPDVFRDPRGYFYESYNKPKFSDLGIPNDFIQDNESLSSKGVLRGLHFQVPPFSQGKLIRVVKGAVLDVAVDLRKDSPTFGKYVSFELSEENKLICWIPAGFAHGFLTLRDETIFTYKCTNYYHRDSERSIRWNDPDIHIDWNYPDPLLSDKDKDAMLFKNFHSPF